MKRTRRASNYSGFNSAARNRKFIKPTVVDEEEDEDFENYTEEDFTEENEYYQEEETDTLSTASNSSGCSNYSSNNTKNKPETKLVKNIQSFISQTQRQQKKQERKIVKLQQKIKQLREQIEILEENKFVVEVRNMSNEKLFETKKQLKDSLVLVKQELEDREEKEKRCVVCLVEQKGIVFMPCKHCCCCNKCSNAIVDCPLCRRKIKNKMKIFL